MWQEPGPRALTSGCGTMRFRRTSSVNPVSSLTPMVFLCRKSIQRWAWEEWKGQEKHLVAYISIVQTDTNNVEQQAIHLGLLNSCISGIKLTTKILILKLCSFMAAAKRLFLLSGTAANSQISIQSHHDKEAETHTSVNMRSLSHNPFTLII